MVERAAGRRPTVPGAPDAEAAKGILAGVRRYVGAALVLHAQLPPAGPGRSQLHRLALEVEQASTAVAAALRTGTPATRDLHLRATQLSVAGPLLRSPSGPAAASLVLTGGSQEKRISWSAPSTPSPNSQASKRRRSGRPDVGSKTASTGSGVARRSPKALPGRARSQLLHPLRRRTRDPLPASPRLAISSAGLGHESGPA